MGFLSKLGGALVNPIGAISSAVGFNALGKKSSNAMLSGIPFIGEGFAQQQSQDFNADQSALNRQWQERMSGSAHQREMADLKAAGLNPILTTNAGASTPAGAQAQGSGMSGASSASNMMKSVFNQEKQKNQQTINLLKEQKGKTTAEKEAAQKTTSLLNKYGDADNVARIKNTTTAAELNMSNANYLKNKKSVDNANVIINGLGTGANVLNPLKMFKGLKPK